MFADNPVEWRANAFAAHLLMPERGIQRILESWGETSPPSDAAVTGLMLHFQVSLTALVYQLNQLRLLSFDDGARLRSEGPHRLVRAFGGSDAAAVLNPPERVRPPARLYRRAIEAFRHHQIGLGLVASLLEQPDDDALYRKLTESLPGEPSTAPAHQFRV